MGATGKLVPTPQGFRDEACVVEIPDGATFRETADGLTITHANVLCSLGKFIPIATLTQWH